MTLRISSSFYKNRFLSLSLGITAFILLARYPYILIEPRFWAEEGSVYFASAYNHAANVNISSFFNSYYFGYFNLIANFSAVLSSHLIPLEFAPYLSLVISFAIQLIPTAIVASSSSSFWGHPLRKALGILGILFIPNSGESWLNTINSQYYLALTCFLILLEAPEALSQKKKVFFRGLLIVSGLSGPQAIFLTPVFFFKWFQTRTRESLTQFFYLTFTALIQVIPFVLSLKIVTGRIGNEGLSTYFFISEFRNWILPILSSTGIELYAPVSQLYITNRSLGLSVALMLFVIMILFWVGIARQIQEKRGWWSLGSFFLTATLTWLVMLPPKINYLLPYYGVRYFVLTSGILAIAMAGAIDVDALLEKRSNKPSLLILLIYCLALLNGIIKYHPTSFADLDWPSWRSEVKAWREDPKKSKIKIWPPGWEIELVK